MNPFTVSSPTNVADAAATLAKGGAAILAGGSELIHGLKAMNSPATSPATLVNLKTITPSLAYINVDASGILHIGALTTLATIANNSTVFTKYTALAQAAGAAGSPELRNVGTIGGNICQKVECWYYRADDNLFNCLRKSSTGICYSVGGDNRYHSIFGGVNGCFAVNPSDTAAALTAFGASIVTNKKTWAIKDFFAVNGENTTALAVDEIITEIQIPALAAGTTSAFNKFALRKSFDFPIVNCAAVITQTGGVVSAASIALNAVHNLPRKATEAETSITGKAITTATADAAGTAAVSAATAMPANANTTTIGNKYMIQIAKTLVKRTLIATTVASTPIAVIPPSPTTTVPPTTTIPSTIYVAPTTTVPPTTTTASTGTQIVVTDSTFQPLTATISHGTAVTFLNDGEAAHTVVSGTLFSHLIAAGASWTYTFATAGTYNFNDLENPQIIGTLTVT